MTQKSAEPVFDPRCMRILILKKTLFHSCRLPFILVQNIGILCWFWTNTVKSANIFDDDVLALPLILYVLKRLITCAYRAYILAMIYKCILSFNSKSWVSLSCSNFRNLASLLFQQISFSVSFI